MTAGGLQSASNVFAVRVTVLLDRQLGGCVFFGRPNRTRELRGLAVNRAKESRSTHGARLIREGKSWRSASLEAGYSIHRAEVACNQNRTLRTIVSKVGLICSK
jgi:hypothetical protein